MHDFNYISAGSIDEVVELLSNGHGSAKILSGGTDLIVQLRENRTKADLVIDVKGIPDLTEIVFDAQQGLRLGAAASCFQISHDPDISAHYPGIVDAVSLIGGVQIQCRASVGGNLCNASPAADAIPALIVHNAACLIAGPQGKRQVPVEAFCTAPGKTCLEKGEFLVSILLPPPKPNFGAHYLRFIPRNEMDIAVVGAGAGVVLDGKGAFTSARLALAAVAPTPLFVDKVGAFLVGKSATPENIKEAAEIAREAARPISDLRGTAAQRKHLSGVLARRALEKAVERAKAEA